MQSLSLRMNSYRGRVIGGGATAILARIRAWQDRRRAVAQLGRLNDRQLADIGLDRGQIPQVVEDLVSARAAANDNRADIAA